uniref:Uncharacterized protein n=1 Tax=Salix viminalis TaxID=40686 RepID=A0A6N2KF42_SALVM
MAERIPLLGALLGILVLAISAFADQAKPRTCAHLKLQGLQAWQWINLLSEDKQLSRQVGSEPIATFLTGLEALDL